MAEAAPLETSAQLAAREMAAYAEERATDFSKANSLTSTCSSPRSCAASPTGESGSETPAAAREGSAGPPDIASDLGAPPEGASLPPYIASLRAGAPEQQALSKSDAGKAAAHGGPSAPVELAPRWLGAATPTTPSTISQDLLCGVCDEDTPTDEAAKYLSLGSIGHPHSCAEACRYIKRKGGCLDSARCTRCHLCFWTRVSDKPVVPPEITGEQAIVSLGTKGHPYTCGEACRYARRKGGCRDGASCINCHACLWQRSRPSKPEQPFSTIDEPAQEEEAEQFSGPATTPRSQETAVVPQSEPSPGEPGFFGQSSDKLTELIATMLVTRI